MAYAEFAYGVVLSSPLNTEIGTKSYLLQDALLDEILLLCQNAISIAIINFADGIGFCAS